MAADQRVPPGPVQGLSTRTVAGLAEAGPGGKARPEKLRVDGQQGLAAHGEKPVVGTDDVKPPQEPIGVHCGALWRAGPRVVADVVVARHPHTLGLIPA